MDWKIIIIGILVLIILYIFIYVKKNDPYKNDPVYKYDDIKENLKTGDIILFSCKKSKSLYKKLEYYIRTNFIGSEYGHAGLIIKNNGQLFLIECTPQNFNGNKYCAYLNNYNKGGIRITPLENMLKIYQKQNTAIFAVRSISKEITIETIDKNLKKYIGFTFEDKNLLYLHGIIDVAISHNLAIWLAYRKNRDKMMCSQFVYQFLYDCGVLKYYPSKLFWPHLINDKLFEDLQIVKYSKPLKFTIEIDQQ